MTMMQVPFSAGAYQSRSLPLDAQRSVNFFTEKAPAKDAESEIGVFGVPGLSLYQNIGEGPVRGFRIVNDILYVVTGEDFYSIDAAGDITDLGGNVPILGSSPVSISDNGVQICIVNGAQGWIFVIATGVLSLLAVDGFYPADTVTFFDGYFVFNRRGTAQFFFSALYDGTTYNDLDYGTKESNSDNLQAVANLHEVLILVGERSIEQWYNTGSNNLPFAPYPGSTVQRGTIAPLTVVLEDNSLFFLGDDLIFYRLDANLPVRLSTHVMETEWAAYGYYSNAFCFISSWEGHKFIVLTFPSVPVSWVYDIATGLWHERESWDENNNSLGRWRGNCAITYFGKTLIGDLLSGNVGFWDYDAFTEFGCTIRGLLLSPPIHKDRRRVFMAGLELYMESGVGLSSGQGAAPQILLDWSDDGARTWSKTVRPAAFGAQGQYRQRTRWLRLGQSRTRTLRLTVTDPVRRNIVGAYLNVSLGD